MRGGGFVCWLAVAVKDYYWKINISYIKSNIFNTRIGLNWTLSDAHNVQWPQNIWYRYNDIHQNSKSLWLPGEPTAHAQLFVQTLRWSEVLFNTDWSWRNELQICEEKPQFFLALPFIIFDMFLGDIHCLGHAPFEQTFTIQPQNWQLLCLSVLESCMLNAWGWGQQHARTVWLLPLYLALNMKMCWKKTKPTMAKFVSIPFLAVQVRFWCLLTTAMQKEWQIIREKDYGFPVVDCSADKLCQKLPGKPACHCAYYFIFLQLLVIPEIPLIL